MVLDFLRKVFKRDDELDIDLELEKTPHLENTRPFTGNFRDPHPPNLSNPPTEHLVHRAPQQTFTNTQHFLQPTAYLPQVQSQQNIPQDIEVMKQQIIVLASKIEALNSKVDMLLQKIQMIEQFLYYYYRR